MRWGGVLVGKVSATQAWGPEFGSPAPVLGAKSRPCWGTRQVMISCCAQSEAVPYSISGIKMKTYYYNISLCVCYFKETKIPMMSLNQRAETCGSLQVTASQSSQASQLSRAVLYPGCFSNTLLAWLSVTILWLSKTSRDLYNDSQGYRGMTRHVSWLRKVKNHGSLSSKGETDVLEAAYTTLCESDRQSWLSPYIFLHLVSLVFFPVLKQVIP